MTEDNTTTPPPADERDSGFDWAKWEAGRDRRLENTVRTELPNERR